MPAAKKSSHKNAARSRHLIKQAFAELMNEKDIHKITVTDIVERANISRGTFYAHYLDVYDLSVTIQNNVLEAVNDAISETTLSDIMRDPTQITERSLRFLNENLSYYRLFITTDYAGVLIDRITNLLFDKFTAELEENFPGEDLKKEKTFLIYALGAYKNVILYWFDKSDEYTSSEIAAYISELYIRSKPESFDRLG